MLSFSYLRKAHKGASLVEYGIVVGLVAVVGISSVFSVGTQVREAFVGVASQVSSANITVANGGVAPEPLGPPESCLDPEMIGKVGKSNWTGGCSGQLIVNRDMLRIAVENRSFAIPGPKRSHPIGGSSRAIFTGQVQDMSNLFDGSDFNQDIGWWDTSNVVDMGYMFSFSTFNQPIGQWDTSQVGSMVGMFQGSAFNQPIGSWDLSNVHRMDWMFSDGAVFNQFIGDWDVSQLQTMAQMFTRNYTYNQPMPYWDVSGLRSDGLYGTFNSTALRQDLSGWCVPQFSEEPQFFLGYNGQNANMPAEYRPVWGSCPVQD